MTLLPIQFKTKFKSEHYNELESSKVLGLIENYLKGKGFNYVVRKNDKIVFYKANGLSLFDTKSFLVSGIVKVKKINEDIIVINGNWMVFIIAIPFLIALLITDSRFSTIDENDINIIWAAFIVVFGTNLIIRIIAHSIFKSTIKRLIENNN